MRFTQIDRIVELEPHRRIVAIKTLSLAEEYLRDHFPRFPVMPGVLMLEAMYQASLWLILKSEDFVPTLVVLKEARNVKYGGFVEPGRTLIIVPDATLSGVQSVVEAETRDGRTLSMRCEHPRGAPENRLTRAEIEHKFRTYAAGRLPAGHIDEVVATVARLEELKNTRRLMEWLRAGAAAPARKSAAA